MSEEPKSPEPKRVYVRPEITRVPLRPEEAVLGSCKNDGSGVGGADCTSASCQDLGS
jgi:hypothetical protein